MFGSSGFKECLGIRNNIREKRLVFHRARLPPGDYGGIALLHSCSGNSVVISRVICCLGSQWGGGFV